MILEQAKETVKTQLSCTRYLQKSKNNMFCCPICGSGTKGANSTGAVKYYKDTNTWSCHSCKASGDVLDLIQLDTGAADFMTALSIGASELGITIDSSSEAKGNQNHTKSVPKTDPKKEQPLKEDAAEQIDNTAYYEQCRAALNDPRAVSYLAARGISTETAAAANIGFDAAADPAQSGHKTARIIIPTSKSHYVARSIDSSIDKAFQKMNNKGGTPSIFNAAALYSGAKAVFVLEGAFDALSLLEIGQQAIATNSAGNVKKLLELLQQRPTAATLVICKDNDADERTREQIDKYAQELEQGLQGLNIAYIEAEITGQYKDANEALQHDKAAFMERVQAVLTEINKTDIDSFLKNIQTEAYKPAATGLDFFDDLLSGGIVNKTLTILLAAPAAGKTTLCQQVAEAIARQKRPVIYLNLEMSKEQMLAKSISSMLARKGTFKSTLDILQGYKWNNADKEQITAAAREYEQTIYPYLKYYDAAEIGSGVKAMLDNLNTIGTAAKQSGNKAPVIVLDYLHLLTNDTGKNLDVQELIKQAVVGLKQYAINFDTFVIAISATNRTSNTGKLTLDSARDSSNIDFTGDYAISLNYEDIDNGTVQAADIDKLQQEKPRRMILRVVKGRFIQSGKSVKVLFNTASNLFYGCNEFAPADPKDTPFAEVKRI